MWQKQNLFQERAQIMRSKCLPAGLFNSPYCCSHPTITSKSSCESICVTETERATERNSFVYFWEYICATVCVRMENDQFKQRFAQRRETRPNLGSVTDWVNMKISELLGKGNPENIFSSSYEKKEKKKKQLQRFMNIPRLFFHKDLKHP